MTALRFSRALAARGTPQFSAILKEEIEQQGGAHLPLQQGLSTGSYALDDRISVMINSVTEDAGIIRVRAGIFYAGVIAGCSCADDPTPVNENNEYCEVRFDISTSTGEASVTLLTGAA